MSGEGTFDGRPGRLAGDPEQISGLIAKYEAQAAVMNDASLENALEGARLGCVEQFPKIEEAQRAYQVPSQAFYVFDRHLNRRRLAAANAALAASEG